MAVEGPRQGRDTSRRYLTARKMNGLSQIAGRFLEYTTKPEGVPTLISDPE
jgi:hypothetical protein